MEFKEFKDLLFKKALNNGFEECEIYFSNRESISLSVYEQELEKYNINTTFGLSFRGKINGKIGYSYTEILDEEAIDMLIKNAKEGANSIENDDVQFIYDGDKEYQKVNCYSKELENLNTEKLIELALEIERECKEYSKKVVNLSGCSIGYGNS
ncbi:MAG: TldD/PmbA family protein, partial [Clostridium sp.]|nr:TldD/PmbA family protein [Clostridium sp.]